jgi:hypothetical protein
MNLYNFFIDILKYDTPPHPYEEESLKKFLLKKDFSIIYKIYRDWESNTTHLEELIKHFENIQFIGDYGEIPIREICNFGESSVRTLQWCPNDCYPIKIDFLSIQSKSIYVDEKYLYYYIKSRLKNQTDILNMTVYVPSLEIQKEIIEKNMDREIVIDKLKGNIEKYKKLQSKILKSML